MNEPKISDAGLSGGIAIVTGGSRGIGRAIVEILAASGMEVIFTFRDNAAAANEVIAANPGKKISAEKVDARDSAACAAFVEKIVDRTEKIDLLVNNAGVVRDNLLAMLGDDDIKDVLDTNVTGTFNMTRAVAPYMISKRRGKIVNISSVSGEKGGRGQTNYAASKGAINAVAPGVIETEMSKTVREFAGDQIQSRILLKRIGKPEDIANAVWFLSSKFADYITGEILHVDGGFKME